MFTGILVSKVVFRLLKCLVMTNGAIQASIVLANWQLQLIMSFALAVGFALLLRLKVKK